MKPFKEFIAEKREVTIQTLANYLRQYIQDKLEFFWKEHQVKFLDVYQKAGEAAYGYAGRSFLSPVLKEIEQAGFTLNVNFMAELTTSFERWGPPEERERCMWTIVKYNEQTLGTLVVRYFHDHTQFRLPYIPDVLALQETEHDDIVNALSDVSVRLQHYETIPFGVLDAQHAVWEYAVEIGLSDDRDGKANIDMPEYSHDLTLSQWSRYGWELVSVVPGRGHMTAFFKRPVSQATG